MAGFNCINTGQLVALEIIPILVTTLQTFRDIWEYTSNFSQYFKICIYLFIYLFIYSTTSHGTANDVLQNPRVTRNHGWEMLV
jgi:hypothetical protein